MSDELKPKEEDQELNPQQGEEDDDLGKYFDPDEKEKEDKPNPEDLALKTYNEKVGKNYKSWDEAIKRDHEMDTVFAKKQVQKEEEEIKPVRDNTLEEINLKIDAPLSRNVIDKMKKAAKVSGMSLTEMWKDESGYWPKLAASIEQKEKSKNRVSQPSNNIEGEEEDSEEKKMSQKFMKNFPPGFDKLIKKVK